MNVDTGRNRILNTMDVLLDLQGVVPELLKIVIIGIEDDVLKRNL